MGKGSYGVDKSKLGKIGDELLYKKDFNFFNLFEIIESALPVAINKDNRGHSSVKTVKVKMPCDMRTIEIL